jgi:hypothetical protein
MREASNVADSGHGGVQKLVRASREARRAVEVHPRRLILAALFVGSGILSSTAHAALPAPGCKDSVGGGFTYVGTENPGTVTAGGPPPSVPPVDVGAISVVTADGPGGSREVTVHGGNLDVVHFGAGLSQLFEGDASIDAFVHAEIGSIHLAESAAAETLPIRYEAFPGALGENPFYAQAEVSIDGCCDDVITVPATQSAPNVGDLTTVTLQVGYSGNEKAGADFDIDLGNAPRPSAFLSLADGTDLGGVISGSRMLGNVPVLTPIALRFCFGGQLVVTAGHDLPNQFYGTVYQHGGDIGSDHAFYNALNTAEIKLTNEDGVGATGATGHDYGTFSGGSTITSTTTTTTTSTFVPPSTLPSCAGYCGDGIVQADCAETCECPMVGGLAVAVCEAGTAIPALTPDCARCVGCAVDLTQCAAATTTSTTASGPLTTTSTSLSSSTSTTAAPSTTTTTLPGACEPVPAFRSLDCRLGALLDRIDGESDLGTFGPKLVRALSTARSDVDAASGMCASAQLKSARRRLKTAIRDMIKYAHHLRTLAARKKLATAIRNALLAAGDPIGRDLGILRSRLQCPSEADAPGTREMSP